MNKSKTCAECDQAVYALEQVTAGQFTYHKWCFRCAQCNRTLSPSSYVLAPSGIPYCKPHYAATRNLRGGYEDFAVSYAPASSNSTAEPTVSPTDTPMLRLSTKPRCVNSVSSSGEVSPTDVVFSRSCSFEPDDDTPTGCRRGNVSRVKAIFESFH